MRLVIISSDADGRVSLASQQVHGDATEATRELARLFGDGTLDASAAYYTVDMDTAVPVIVLAPPPMAAAAAPPAVEPMDEPFASGVAEEPAAESAEVSPWVIADEPAVEAEPESAPAVDAPVEAPLQSAAPETAAQWPWDLPVVVPEGIDASSPEAADEPASPPDESPAVEELEVPPVPDEVEAPAVVQVAEEAPADEQEPPIAEAAAEPDVEVSDDQPLPVAEPHGVLEADAVLEPVADPVSAEEPVAEEAPSFTVPVDAAETDAPAVGASESDTPAASDPLDAFRVVTGGGYPEPGTEPEAEVAEVPVDALAVTEPHGVLEAAAAAEAVADPPADDRVYEPGALNMNEYTCDDCVYVNTCPNQHQKRPAECGSFQWRSI
jgi:hypothetical protein